MTEEWEEQEEWGTEEDETEEETEVSEEDGDDEDFEFEIERDKPMPKPTTRKYPFNKMRIGDSFEVRIKPEVIEERGLSDAVRLQRSALSSSASNFNKRHSDRRMVIRKTGPTTLRCWCVAPE